MHANGTLTVSPGREGGIRKRTVMDREWSSLDWIRKATRGEEGKGRPKRETRGRGPAGAAGAAPAPASDTVCAVRAVSTCCSAICCKVCCKVPELVAEGCGRAHPGGLATLDLVPLLGVNDPLPYSTSIVHSQGEIRYGR